MQQVQDLYRAGKYAEAIPLAQRGLELHEKKRGPDHPDLVVSLNYLAKLYAALGDSAKAESLYQRALAIQEKALGPDHLGVTGSLDTLSELYWTTGSYAKSEPLFERALAIREKTLMPSDFAVVESRANLASVYAKIGEYAKAESLLQRALAIWEKQLGPDPPQAAVAINNLAVLYTAMGDYVKAEKFSLRALAILNEARDPDDPDVATVLDTLAKLYRTTGNYAKANLLYWRVLAIREKGLRPDHPEVAESLINLAEMEAAHRRFSLASEFFKRGLLVQDIHIRNVFNITTEAEKLNFIKSISGAYLAYLSLIHQHLIADAEAIRDGLELVLRRKGVVFDAQSRQREALQRGLPESARKDWDTLSSLLSELAHLLLNKPEMMTIGDYKEKLVSLQRQIENTEKRLASESALVAKELQQRTLTVKTVTKSLPKNAVLVEFVKIRDFDFHKVKWALSWRYLAFVLTAAGDVTLVDLGDADALESLAQRALADIKTSMGTRGIEILKAPCDRSVDPRGIEIVKAPCGRDAGRQSAQFLQELHAQVWAPLEKALGKADKVVLSPDGLLNLVPFAALVDNQGRSLVERYQLAYVTSGRELVGADGAMPKPDSDLLLVANPSFDQKGSAAGRQGTALRSREFRGVFTPLPGTERESREIPPLVVAPKEQKQVLVGERATETAVKTARSPRILHLATHGFFLPDDESALDTVKFGGVPDRGITVVPRPTGKRYENPLVRSGLAFAGANHATGITDGDDGILTALEITGMDLYGTELVVLSACDTGVGEIKTGEGVFGLRRAFALAGAKNLLMSLWEVSDEVTARQMKIFYQNLQKLPLTEALRQAQLETIKELKAEYGGLAPPGLWAPFILQGAQALGQ